MAESKMPDELAELRRENQNLKRQLAERERQLQERKQLIEAIEALPDGLALFDPDERLILCNANYRNLHPVISDVMVPGASIEDILQAAADRGQQRIPDGGAEEWKAGRLAAFRNPGDPIEQQFSDGSWRRVYERKTADGYTAAVRIDITELKAREHALGRIEQRLRDYLDASSDWIWEMDSHCRFSYLSGEFEKHTGVPPDALIGKTPEETGLPNVDPERWDNHLSDLEARRAFRDFRYSRTLPRGDRVQLSISGKAFFDSDGRFLGYRGIGRNVTEQVSAEIRASHAEALLENAVERLSETFALWGPDDRLVLSNRMFRAFNATVIDYTRPGTALEDFYRAGAEKGLFPEAEGREEAWLADRLHSVRNSGKPFEVQRQDGRWLQVNDQKLPDGSLVTIGTDITEQKRSEAALRAAHDDLENRVEERTGELNRANTELRQEIAEREEAQRDLRANRALLLAMIDNNPEQVGLRDLDGRYIFVNKHFLDWNGFEKADVIGRSARDLWPADMAVEFERRDAAVVEKGRPIVRESEINYPDGRTRTMRSVRFPVFIDDGTIIGVGFINTDITEQVRAQRELVDKTALLQSVLDAIPASIALRDMDCRYIFANKYLADTLDRPADDFVGRTAEELIGGRLSKTADALVRDVIETGQPKLNYDFYTELVPDKFGLASIVPLRDGQDEIVGAVGVSIDITERKTLEEQLRQAQKLEAIGQLTGGVSHDFNNLLGVIIGNLEILEDLLPADASGNGKELRALVRAAMSASEKGAKLNKQLLAFSRRQMLAPKTIDLNGQISGMVDMLRRTLGETIDVEVVSKAALSPCDADPAQVEAALLNLAINARDAMPGGGKLTIELSNQELDERDVANLEDVAPGSYVLMSVQDTGLGIASDALEHVFEPFFTTKGVGEGSGLGLSMVFGFAKQSGGHVAIESRESEGTTVKLYLPRAAGEVSQTEDEDRVVLRAQGEKVLVVEDDRDIRALSMVLLKDLGYKVVEASDGASALSILEDVAQIDVLLTDVVLPGGMDGRAIADSAKVRNPDIKILFMSGYPRDAIKSRGQLDGDVLLLEKPFRKALLARRLREAIDR